MNNLNYIKSYENYSNELKTLINEGLYDAGQNSLNRAFLKMDEIPLSNGESIKPRDIVIAVKNAIDFLASEYRTYFSFVKYNVNIIYLINCPQCRTMAVDANMNMYMDVLFIYKNLKMDKELIGAVIMHEIFHILYNHIERGKNWLSAHGKNIETDFFDTNLAGDIEVNTTLVKKNIISRERLINELHGLFLDQVHSNGNIIDVIHMEAILENEKVMAKLRSMAKKPQEQNGNGNDTSIDTTDEWDNGYKQGWDKIAELTEKYGAEKVFKKLQEKGIINEKGQLNSDINMDDILGIQFIHIFNFDEFINESKNSNGQFKTEEDGFFQGVKNAIAQIASSLGKNAGGENAGGGDTLNGKNNSPQINSKLSNDDLKSLKLPPSDSTNQQQSQNNGLPQNVQSDNNQSQQQSGNSNNGESQTSGGQSQQQSGNSNNGESQTSGGQSQQQSGNSNGGNDNLDGDANTLLDDLKNKSKNAQGNVGYADSPFGKDSSNSEIGNTGTVLNDKQTSKIQKALKESGYSEDAINAIKEIIEKNKVLNSKEGVESKKKELYNKLDRNDPVKKYLDKIMVEESKYKNIWKKIMKDFLSKKSRSAGNDVLSKNYNWKNKRKLPLGIIAVNRLKKAQEPQDINVYVDVSGSVNKDILEIIAQSLCIFAKNFKYSGINIIPWASYSNGSHKVQSLSQSNPDKIAKEILGYIDEGINECGGGTNLNLACVPKIVASVADKKRKEKDDVHIIITDGQTGGDEKTVEDLIQQVALQETKNSHYGKTIAKNCFWMIYDADNYDKKSWEESIKLGKLIFIVSSTVIGNAKK